MTTIPRKPRRTRSRSGGFWIDAGPVTNREFGRFVRKTGYVTVAERAPDPAEYPGARPELLVPFSSVFVAPPHRVNLADPYNWWKPVRARTGGIRSVPAVPIRGLPDHPVVHVTWADVLAYAAWAGKADPDRGGVGTGRAGRAGRRRVRLGRRPEPGRELDGEHLARRVPGAEHRRGRVRGTSPVGAFPANGYGLYDMIGNVWEWTSDWYAGHAATAHACCSGAARGSASVDRQDPARIPRKVMKGGSHLCAPNYCRRYRPGRPDGAAVDTSTSHLGFRCVIRPS